MTFLTSGNKYLRCSSVMNPGQMQRSRPVIPLQHWLNRVAVILLSMTFRYPWAHFNFYGRDDDDWSCDEVDNMDVHAHAMRHFILKSLNCASRIMQDCSSSSLLAHLYSYLLVLLHSFVLLFAQMQIKMGCSGSVMTKSEKYPQKGWKSRRENRKDTKIL